MSGWSIKEFFDEVIFELYNLFNFFAAFKYKKYLEKIHLDCTTETETNLILNGPSSVDIKVEDCKFNFFVNYGYKHPLFSKVKSPILIVVDTKIIKGKWDMDMLREAEEANPSVRFIFNYKYIKSDDFKNISNKINCVGYINNSKIPTRFNWKKILKVGGFNFGIGVAEQSLSLLASLSFKKINIYGFDGNNVILALMSQNTHFYGQDESKTWNDPQFISRELRFLSYFVDRNYWLSKCLRYNKIQIINYSSSMLTSMYSER